MGENDVTNGTICRTIYQTVEKVDGWALAAAGERGNFIAETLHPHRTRQYCARIQPSAACSVGRRNRLWNCLAISPN